MSLNRILGVREVEGARKIEISLRRIALWALIFSNAFCVPYFFAKLFRLI
ncbi:MAG: hypothetical protein ACPL6D_15380 [Thermodesulfobacteriota bacterium]